MSRINFLGSYSGIDGSQIDKLMEVEKLPLVQMSQKKVDIDTKKGAWKDVNTRLKSLFDRLNDLKKQDLYSTKRADVKGDGLLTVKASNTAVEGQYRIKIDKLATNSKIQGDRIKDTNSEDGYLKATDKIGKSGTIYISNDNKKIGEDGEVIDNKISIEINEDDSLVSIAEKINSKSVAHRDENDKLISGTGIKAVIIGDRLVLEDEKSGERYINLSTDEGSTILKDIGLSQDKLEKGKNAKLLVNGIEIESNSNEVKDAVHGLTINLQKVTDKEEVITVSQDYEKIEDAISKFVDQYNSTLAFIEEKIETGDPEIPGSGGDLRGDASLQRLQKELRKLVTDVIKVPGSNIRDISELGVTTVDKKGDLKFDKDLFREYMKKDPESVKNFFNNKSDGKDIGYVERLNIEIDGFISTKNGIIKSKNESFDRVLKDLNTRIDKFNERMEKKEEYYIKMFSQLDIVMMKAESQMSWLQNQVNAMNPQKK